MPPFFRNRRVQRQWTACPKSQGQHGEELGFQDCLKPNPVLHHLTMWLPDSPPSSEPYKLSPRVPWQSHWFPVLNFLLHLSKATTEVGEGRFLLLWRMGLEDSWRAMEASSVALNKFDSFPIMSESTILTCRMTFNCTFGTCLSLGYHVKIFFWCQFPTLCLLP